MCEKHLWAAVAATVIMDLKDRIDAATKGERFILVDGRKTNIGPVEWEIKRARKYIHSPSWAEITEMAGISGKPEKAMQWLEAIGGTEIHTRRNSKSLMQPELAAGLFANTCENMAAQRA